MIAHMVATTNKQAIVRAFRMMTKPRQDRDVTNPGFPHQRDKPCKLRPTSSEESGHCNTHREPSQMLSDPAEAKQAAKHVRGKGENRTS